MNNICNYSQLIDKLFSINVANKVKLGLDDCNKWHAKLGYPAKTFKSIHVAGTNGKGSVCTKIAAGLEKEGYNVGLFTSPHISTFRERIQINGKMISREDVVKWLTLFFDININATFFELATLLALVYFSKERVDYAVIETGLGGRLDATNIIVPEIAVITSISFDHCAILGNTLEEIAHEKAGIIKPGIPVIIGPNTPFSVFQRKALDCNARLYQVEGVFPSYEEENQAIAKRALALIGVSEPSIQEGIIKKPPCRFQVVEYKSSKYILDVAHNPDGFKKFFEKIKGEFPDKPIYGVVGVSRGKDIDRCFDTLFENSVEVHFIQGSHERSLSIIELETLVKVLDYSTPSFFHHSIQDALLESSLKANNHEGIIAICGSFFIMSEVRRLLGILEESDFQNLNERF